MTFCKDRFIHNVIIKHIFIKKRKEVNMSEFPVTEIATAIMALVSYLLGRLTKRVKK